MYESVFWTKTKPLNIATLRSHAIACDRVQLRAIACDRTLHSVCRMCDRMQSREIARDCTGHMLMTCTSDHNTQHVFVVTSILLACDFMRSQVMHELDVQSKCISIYINVSPGICTGRAIACDRIGRMRSHLTHALSLFLGRWPSSSNCKPSTAEHMGHLRSYN